MPARTPDWVTNLICALWAERIIGELTLADLSPFRNAREISEELTRSPLPPSDQPSERTVQSIHKDIRERFEPAINNVLREPWATTATGSLKGDDLAYYLALDRINLKNNTRSRKLHSVIPFYPGRMSKAEFEIALELRETLGWPSNFEHFYVEPGKFRIVSSVIKELALRRAISISNPDLGEINCDDIYDVLIDEPWTLETDALTRKIERDGNRFRSLHHEVRVTPVLGKAGHNEDPISAQNQLQWLNLLVYANHDSNISLVDREKPESLANALEVFTGYAYVILRSVRTLTPPMDLFALNTDYFGRFNSSPINLVWKLCEEVYATTVWFLNHHGISESVLKLYTPSKGKELSYDSLVSLCDHIRQNSECKGDLPGRDASIGEHLTAEIIRSDNGYGLWCPHCKISSFADEDDKTSFLAQMKPDQTKLETTLYLISSRASLLTSGKRNIEPKFPNPYEPVKAT